MDQASWQQMWPICLRFRQWQRQLGRFCAILLGLCLLCLLDGLQALHREEDNLVELLPGGESAVSGQSLLSQPQPEDLLAEFTPSAAGLSFELEGFSTGYLLGNGIWRGHVLAATDVPPGRHALVIRFRGTPQAARQVYPVIIYASATQQRQASSSLLRRQMGLSAFALAGVFLAFGLLAGIAVYLLGRRIQYFFKVLCLGEVVMAQSDSVGDLRFWCLPYGTSRPRVNESCQIYDACGRPIGQARAIGVKNGMLEMSASVDVMVRHGCLVRLGDAYLAGSEADDSAC